jgi:general nucleoside transport system permease protein
VTRRWTTLRTGLVAAAVSAFALVTLFFGLAFLHYDALGALGALWTGSVGSWYALTSGTLVRAIPLILTGLAVTVAFRGGVFNVGAEGQLLLGAIAAAVVVALVGNHGGWGLALVALFFGAVAGAAWAGIAAYLRLRFGVLEVISTIMLNFVAEDLVSYLVRGPLQEHRHIYPQSETMPAAMRLSHILPNSRLHWGIVLAVALAVGVWWVLGHTAAGFRLRVIGANPFAARVSGRIRVDRVAALALVLSGALAGLAGALEVTGVTYALYENLSPGYGFTAIAVAVLAGLHPLGVLGSGLVFAALETGATAMQRDAGVPSVLASVLEALAILSVLGAVQLRRRLERVARSPV